MNVSKAIFVLLLLLTIGVYVSTSVHPRTAQNTTTPTRALFASVQSSTNCHERDGLPDPSCTPGSANPSVDQSNIATTICKPGFSGSIRPAVSYTEPLKKKQVVAYGYSDVVLSHYEEDHLVSLELGGSPTDPANLWPEPAERTYGSKQKDKVENYLHQQVCSGAIGLSEAQVHISTNWITVYQSMPQELQ